MAICNFGATARSPTWELNSHLVLSILDFRELGDQTWKQVS